MRLKWAIVVVAVCVVVTVAAVAYAAGKATAEAPEVTRAQRFELVDSTGRVVAGLVTGEDQAAELRFRDSNGDLRLTVGLNKNGEPRVRLHDGAGRPNGAELSVRGPEDDAAAGLSLWQGGARRVDLISAPYTCRLRMDDADSMCYSHLSVESGGWPVLAMENSRTKARAQLELRSQGSANLVLESQERKGKVDLSAWDRGGSELTLFGEGASGAANLSTSSDGSSRLHLTDNNGEPGIDLRVGSDGRPAVRLGWL